LSFPIGVAPTAAHCMAHPDGEIATAKGANAADTLMIVSSAATKNIEEVAAASPNAKKWFQVYFYDDRSAAVDQIRRAEAAGYSALVLTVDIPLLGKRREDMRNKFALPPHMRLVNYPPENVTDPSKDFEKHYWSKTNTTMSWEIIPWLRSLTRLPLLIKGILTREDAIEAVKHNVDAIIVSNHGGRQLDSVLAPIEALPEVVEAVAGRCDVYVDGGIRTGGDVFKALALGAKCVFVGRPVIHGLAHSGEAGVRKVLEILQTEFDLCMALAGVRNVLEINRRSIMYESEMKGKL